MSPRTVADAVLRPTPLVRVTATLGEAVRALLESGLPGLPAIDAKERYVGLFGEREFLGALFPRYVQTLGYAGFVSRSIEDALDKRRPSANDQVREWLNTEHVDVPADAADLQLAETFLHHRVILVPVVDGARRVTGVVLRRDFFAALAERYLASD